MFNCWNNLSIDWYKMNNLNNIIKQLIQSLRETDISPSDDVIFKCAVKIYISESIQESKQSNMNFMKDIKEAKVEDKPTDKQIAFMDKKHLKVSPDLTKEKAKQIIKEYIDNQNKFHGGK